MDASHEYPAPELRKATVLWTPGKVLIVDRQTNQQEEITLGVGQTFNQQAVEALLAARNLAVSRWVTEASGGRMAHAW